MGVLRPSEISSIETEALEVAWPAQSHSGALGQIKQAAWCPESGGQELSPLFLSFSNVEIGKKKNPNKIISSAKSKVTEPRTPVV